MDRLGMAGRKWEIFESAVYEFAKYGYENVSMRDIAEIHNVQAASLYYYFDSKETLLELMYEFYSVNVLAVAPDLEEILAQIPNGSPKDILFQSMSYFGEDLQPLMDCIYIVAVTQANRDKRAYDLIRKNTFAYAKAFMTTVLQKMLDLGRIEPLDIDTFTLQYSSFAFTAAVLNRMPDRIKSEDWIRGLDMLFSLVKEKSPREQTETQV